VAARSRTYPLDALGFEDYQPLGCGCIICSI
jgi:hypothetical protein